jgi:hypothetical protein
MRLAYFFRYAEQTELCEASVFRDYDNVNPEKWLTAQ